MIVITCGIDLTKTTRGNIRRAFVPLACGTYAGVEQPCPTDQM